MPWLDRVNGVMQSWYLGSEAGHATAAVICGEVNPSGNCLSRFPAGWRITVRTISVRCRTPATVLRSFIAMTYWWATVASSSRDIRRTTEVEVAK